MGVTLTAKNPARAFNMGYGGLFCPTLLTVLIMIVPMFLYREKIIDWIDNLVNQIGL